MADRLEEYLRRILEGQPATPLKRPKPAREAVEAEVVNVVEIPEPSGRLQDEIAENLGARATAQRAPDRAGETAPLGEQPPPGTKPLSASEVAALLRSPQRLREAIVVSEILKRPEW